MPATIPPAPRSVVNIPNFSMKASIPLTPIVPRSTMSLIKSESIALFDKSSTALSNSVTLPLTLFKYFSFSSAALPTEFNDSATACSASWNCCVIAFQVVTLRFFIFNQFAILIVC